MIMKMEEEGDIALNDTFQDLVPEYAESELKNVTVLKALSHYGRLPAWIAFYVDTLDKNRKPSKEFYRDQPMDGFSIRVTDHLFLTDAYKDSIYDRIGRQELKSNRYRYSDVAYYVMKKYIEDKKKRPLDELVNEFLYEPIGALRTSYNPLEKYKKEAIVPSEEDKYYRYETVQAMCTIWVLPCKVVWEVMPGFFSNAEGGVAKIMQMYLQGGGIMVARGF